MDRLIRAATAVFRDQRLRAQIIFALVWAFLAGLVVFAPVHGA